VRERAETRDDLASFNTVDRLAEPIGTALVDFGNFWPEVPEPLHIGAHPRASTGGAPVAPSEGPLQIDRFLHESRPKLT